MSKLIQPARAAFEELLENLDLDQPVDLVYEYGDRDTFHVWIVCDCFEGRDYIDRREMMKAALQRLAPQVRVRISLLFYLTHTEFGKQYQTAPSEFDEPQQEATNDGPFRLSKLPAAA